MTKIHFGVDLDWAVNRYPEPEQWARVVSEELEVGHAQFRSDLLQPHFPDEIIDEQVARIKESCKRYDIKLLHTFTSQRWNYCGNPEEKIREYWHWWLKRFSDISARLGAIGAGSRLGIYSFKDIATRREFILNEIVRYWRQWAEHAKKSGLQCLTFEHMSIPRELADTIEDAQKILDMMNNGERKPAIPILLCLDTDQGNNLSGDPRDGDPYEWIRTFVKESPILQLKQRIKGNITSGKPFTAEYNKDGIIFPDRVIETIEDSGAKEMWLYLEPSFRERLPHDSNVIHDLKESVVFWKPYVSE